MAPPFALAAALARTTTITCPYCRHRKLVMRGPAVAYRVCPKCHKHFPDPLAPMKRTR